MCIMPPKGANPAPSAYDSLGHAIPTDVPQSASVGRSFGGGPAPGCEPALRESPLTLEGCRLHFRPQYRSSRVFSEALAGWLAARM